MKPLQQFTLPNATSQGWFGAVRKHDIHTGIDLYCNDRDPVQSIEDGIVVKVVRFTGPDAGSPWWEDTDAVLVRGHSGVILYGEVTPCVTENAIIKEGTCIGHVKRVLRKDKGKPTSMLHLELYRHGYCGDGEVWDLGQPKHPMLKNPIGLLLPIETYPDPSVLGFVDAVLSGEATFPHSYTRPRENP